MTHCFNFYSRQRENLENLLLKQIAILRGGSRAAATSKMKRFVIIVNGFQPLTIITKHSILDVEAALDPPVNIIAK